MPNPVFHLAGRASNSLRKRWVHTWSNLHVQALAEDVQRSAPHPAPEAAPVLFFNASTRLEGISLNAAYSLSAEWALRMASVPTARLTCQGGLTRCVLGVGLHGPQALPPCPTCIAQSHALNGAGGAHWFVYHPEPALEEALKGLDVPALAEFDWRGAPLGALCLPALRWSLRRHTLPDDEITRGLFRQYILSARRVIEEIDPLLERLHPRALVVFNGMFYPEAAARWAARWRGIPVVSHEVGLRPFSAFFTPGEATAYPISIPESFQMDAARDARLDAYLEKRMHGRFSMAGVQFWPEMRGLDETLLERMKDFSQVVPVFTNVIFDTSQPHSNVVFEHMFAWLDEVLEVIRVHPETLFVLRAHPDETRPGKASRESVAEWVQRSGAAALPNLVFIPSDRYLSSYELIQRARFVMLYNSTIGLEAAILGAPVLCAGKARFTQVPTVFFPQSVEEYRRTLEEFLTAERVSAPPEFRENARRFLYYQLYCTSLSFEDLLTEDGIWTGYVRFKAQRAADFDPDRSPVLRAIVDGILHDRPFVLEG